MSKSEREREGGGREREIKSRKAEVMCQIDTSHLLYRELTVVEEQCQHSRQWTLEFEGRRGSWWMVWCRKMKRQRRGLGWGRGGSDLQQHGTGEQTEGASDCSQGDC